MPRAQLVAVGLFDRPAGHPSSPGSPGQRPLRHGKAEEEGAGVPGRAAAEEQPEGPHPVLRGPPRGRQNERGQIRGQDPGPRVPQDRARGRVRPVGHPGTQVGPLSLLTFRRGRAPSTAKHSVPLPLGGRP